MDSERYCVTRKESFHTHYAIVNEKSGRGRHRNSLQHKKGD